MRIKKGTRLNGSLFFYDFDDLNDVFRLLLQWSLILETFTRVNHLSLTVGFARCILRAKTCRTAWRCEATNGRKLLLSL